MPRPSCKRTVLLKLAKVERLKKNHKQAKILSIFLKDNRPLATPSGWYNISTENFRLYRLNLERILLKCLWKHLELSVGIHCRLDICPWSWRNFLDQTWFYDTRTLIFFYIFNFKKSQSGNPAPIVKGCKFWPTLCTCCLWAVLQHATPTCTVTRDTRFWDYLGESSDSYYVPITMFCSYNLL